MSKFWIYVAGVAIGGVGYQLLKSVLTDPVLLATAIVYAILLRLLSEKFGK